MRLSSGFWVRAYLTHLQSAGIPAFVVAKGDAERGDVMVKLNLLDGSARLYQRLFDLRADRYAWKQVEAGRSDTIDAQLERQNRRDKDLWIIEVEDRDGRALLEEFD
ncbi:MAG: DUF1491 family protein [Rhodobacteraceae bacterium]|nr:DUF1491 family protein [Paracoccaceae bacterium]